MSKIKDKFKIDLSIVTIAYEVNSDLERCLDSCKFNNILIEHILIFPQKERKISNSRFINYYKVFFDKGVGIYNAINLGLSKAKGKKILILHGDNFLTQEGPKLIEKNINYDNIQFGCNYILKRKIKKFFFPRIKLMNLLFGLYPPHPGLILSRIDYQNLNFYNEKYKICSDFDFYLRIYKSDIKIKYISKEVINTPLGGLSSSGLKSVISIMFERFKILSKEYWYIIPLLPLSIIIGYIIKLINRKVQNLS